MARLGVSPHAGLKAKQRLALTPRMRQSIAVLSLRGAGISRLAEDLQSANPLLDITLPEDHPLSGHGQDIPLDMGHISGEALHPVTLAEHLFRQINQSLRDPSERAVAMALVEHVSPAGWLDPSGVEAARSMGMDEAAFEELMARLHELEPAGVFARNLAECLRIQLADQGRLTESATAVLAHLDLLPEEGVAGLARITGLDPQEIEAVLAGMRSCNPRPGAGFLVDRGDIFRPDLIIEKSEHGYSIAVNQASLPRVELMPEDDGEEDEATRLLRKKAREEAGWLNAAIRQRSAMLLEAGVILLRVQKEFLDQGDAGIRPYRMQDLAEEMGCHKSTISRLVVDKLCQTPRGMIALKDFFAVGLGQPDGSQVAGRAVSAHISRLVAEEDISMPLSDDTLAEKLGREGIIVARRTIAKYRQLAGLPNWRGRLDANSMKPERK
ncbi:RNA polymerase factor sigma-54 [Alphaproteobacteria bacterium LSUCC0684]